ncbi:histone-fold-containing protein, partial [Schizophyllum commune]
MPRAASSNTLTAQNQQELISEGIENFELPKSVVTKIAKSALPDNVKLQKETVLSLIKGSTVFINYLAASAHDLALQKAHKSVSASDVLKALEVLEFGDLVEPLNAELNIFRGAPAKPADNKGRRSSTATTPGTTYTSATTGGKGKAPPGTTASKGPAVGSASTAGKGKAREDVAYAAAGASISTGYPGQEDVDMDADVDAAILDAAGVGEEDSRQAHEEARLAAEAAYALEGRSPPHA